MARPIAKKKSNLSNTESETWRGTERGFSIHDRNLCGELIIRGDGPGLRHVSWLRFGRRDPTSSPVLLSVQSASASHHPTFTIGSGQSSPECRVRGGLVDVQLEPTDRCPVRTHIYWTVADPSRLDMEVLVSSVHGLETLEVQTMSELPSGEVLVRGSGAGSGWLDVHDARALGSKWLVLPRDRMAGIMSLDGRAPAADSITLTGFYEQPVVLYRPAGRRWSYVEMSRPDDCARIVARIERRGASVSFGLFGLDIEKGVILRGRLRGMFIPRVNDLRTCLRLFSRFVAESPRLSV